MFLNFLPIWTSLFLIDLKSFLINIWKYNKYKVELNVLKFTRWENLFLMFEGFEFRNFYKFALEKTSNVKIFW